MKNLLVLSIISLMSCSSGDDTLTEGYADDYVCGNLIEEPGEECDSDSDNCSECTYSRMIYVNTTRSFTAVDIGNNSLEDLNNFCKSTAVNNGFNTTKTWKAWISKTNDNVKDRIFQSPGLYINYAGDVIAYSFTDLTDGTINMPILYDQSGKLSSSEVWTGTLTNGQASDANCDNWSSDNGFFGTYGKNDSILKDWTSNDLFANCANRKYMYCFESEYLP